MHRTLVSLLAVAALSACTVETGAPPTTTSTVPAGSAPDRVSSSTAVANFRSAVARVEPVAERVCREQGEVPNCDFLIQVDPNPRQPPNAFQSLTRAGRPVLTFTQSLIADARNIDEIAFVIGHEAAHHIENHIGQQRRSAQTGALIGAVIGSAVGADAATVEQLGRAGATVGARRYSKENELEADAVGARIVIRAGFDPVRGAAFFTRIPDPGDRFLGTHPPNAQRIETVRRVASGA